MNFGKNLKNGKKDTLFHQNSRKNSKRDTTFYQIYKKIVLLIGRMRHLGTDFYYFLEYFILDAETWSTY